MSGAAASAQASVPTNTAIEGVLLSSAGGPAADGNYTVAISIYGAETGGSAVWTESGVTIAAKGGQFSYQAGAKTPLSAATLSLASAWIGVQVGSDPELPRKPLGASPFALRAAIAEGLDCTGCLKAGHLDTGILQPYAKSSDLGAYAKSADLSAYAKTADLSSFAKATDLADYVKASSLAKVAGTGAYADLIDKPTLAKVATSGSYADLLNAPVLPKLGAACGTGLVMRGLKSDGSYDCISTSITAADLPPDGLNEVSGGLLTTQFNEVSASSNVPLDIPDGFAAGVSDELTIGDLGTAESLSVSVDLTNSDLSKVRVYVYDPNGTKYTLHDQSGSGTALKATYPDPTKLAAGDLSTWIGKNPKGKWSINVADLVGPSGAKDGKLLGWSVGVKTLSTSRVAATGGLQFANSDIPKVPCSPSTFGTTYASPKAMALLVCNGTEYAPLSLQVIGTAQSPGKSCADIKAKSPTSADGMYWLTVAGAATQVYCDMTTKGGGWALVSYGYRASTGGTDVYFLPSSNQGSWEPATRNGKGAINAVEMLKAGTEVALTVTNGGNAVAGNLLDYELAYTWAKPASYNTFSLPLVTTGSVQVSVTELKANSTFNALTFDNRPQVSCSGHTGGTSYERQFIGFNSATHYGVCGSDPVSSNGMVVWYGDGYSPTTSGGKGNPARAGSFGFWIR